MEGKAERLDLGALLARGEHPFTVVESCIRNLPLGGRLELWAPFEPVPLYPHLARWGTTFTVEPRTGGYCLHVEKTEPSPVVPGFLDLRDLGPEEAIRRLASVGGAMGAGEFLIAHFLVLPDPRVLAEALAPLAMRWEEQPQADGTSQLYLLRESAGAAGSP